MNDDPEADKGEVLRQIWARRDFLAFGSFFTAAACLEGAVAGHASHRMMPDPEQPMSVRRPRAMSVGYVEDSVAWAESERLPWDGQGLVPPAHGIVRVVPARNLSLGDSELAVTPPRVIVHGLYPFLPQRGSSITTIWFDQLLPYVDPGSHDWLRFVAWTYSGRPAVNMGHAIAFRALANPWLGFSLAVGAGAPLGRRLVQGMQGAQLKTFEEFLVAGSDADRPKLKTGIYLLGLSDRTWRAEVVLPGQGERPRVDLLSVALSVRPEAGA
jgi:hypothetical protein